jgi:hypothetical protein
MTIRSLAQLALSLLLAVGGYFFFAIVIAVYAGLWLHGEKMYYAREPWCHVFGGVGAALGLLLAWAVARVFPRPRGRPG